MPPPPVVFVVDDDPILRGVLRDVLEEAGYRVEDAANGATALVQLRTMRPPPAMILLDHAMPDMDGATLAGELGDDPELAQVPVLMMSGLVRSAAPSARNVHAFLQKPLRLSDVLSAVGLVADSN